MKKLGNLIFGLVLLIALAAAVILAGRSQDTRKSAYFAGSSLSLLPTTKMLATNEVFPVQLWVETGVVPGSPEKAKVDGVSTYICYDNRKLAIGDTAGILNTTTNAFNKVQYISVTSGTYPSGINECLRLAVTSNKPAAELSSGAVYVAKLMFKAIGSGTTGAIIIDRNNSVVSGNSTTTDTSMSINSVAGLTYTIAGGSGPTKTPTIGKQVVWETPEVRLSAGSFKITVDGVEYNVSDGISYEVHSDPGVGDPNYTTLEVTWREYGKEMRFYVYLNADNVNWWSPEFRTYNNNADWVTYRGRFFERRRGDTFAQEAFIQTSVDGGQGKVEATSFKLEVKKFRITGTWPVLKYLISYRNVVSGNMCATGWPVVITAMAPNGTKKVYTGQVPVRDTSITNKVAYRGQLTLTDFPYYQNLAIFIKGPKHLQSKYGVNNQTAYYNQAGGAITLTSDPATTVVQDFTGYPLMPGDLTGATSGVQDGMVDGRDWSYLKVVADRRDVVENGQYLLTDLDGNCQVAGMDTSFFILTLKDKLEQLY